MAKHPIRLGVVCLARKTFDYNAAEKLYRELLEQLKGLEAVELEASPRLVIEPTEAREAGQALAARNIDGLVCVSGTFHLGHLVLELHKALRRPIQLWAFPELPYDGGKIRLNSLCGLNLDASNLYKAGVRNYLAALGPRIDEDWIDALRALRALSSAHVGLVGFRAHGFFNVDVYDPALFRNTGVLLDHYELEELYGLEVTEREVGVREEQIESIFELSGISREQLRLSAGLTARLDAFLRRHGLSALAIRCWPEFAASYGISPCSAMSVLQAEGRVLACEGDVDGALSMLAQSAVGAQSPYLFDFSQASFEEDYALLWHCGVAPCNLWDGKCVRSLDSYFAGGKGVTADFVLKPGPISYLRLDSCGERYRVLAGRGQGLPMDKQLKGTYLKARFQKPVRELFQQVVDNGLAHHASAVYGEYVRPFERLAGIQGWELIR
jgi:L-fucose isomerase-like protein